MKRLLFASTFCTVLLLFGLATPSHASVIIGFSDASLGPVGDVSTSGTVPGIDTVIGLLADFDTLSISGAPTGNGTYGSLFLVEQYCTTAVGALPTCGTGETPNVIYVYGNIAPLNSNLNFGGLNFADPLLTVTLSASPGLTANVTGTMNGSAIIFPTDVTSVAFNSVFLSDLGLSGLTPTLTGMTGAMVQTAPNSFISTESLTFQTATPEPGSWLLMGVGSALVLFAARKRFSKAV
jgi:hypothetical protein